MASEPKTRPTDVPVSEFIAAVENPRRRAEAEVVRGMMEEITGDQAVMWGPSIIGFGSYPTKSGDWPRAGFSPRKAEMVIYLVPEQEQQKEQLSRLGPHRMNVSCLYIKNLDKVDHGVLRELIQTSHDEMAKRYPVAAQ